jgi:hypothetical protein
MGAACLESTAAIEIRQILRVGALARRGLGGAIGLDGPIVAA